jgi:hypothetical protein
LGLEGINKSGGGGGGGGKKDDKFRILYKKEISISYVDGIFF